MSNSNKCAVCGKPIEDRETKCIGCTLGELVRAQLNGVDMEPMADVELLEYRKDSTGIVITRFLGGVEEITVPEKIEGAGVYKIGKEAFADDSDIKRVLLPASVRYIEERAFADTTLSEIVLPEGLVEIGREAFDNSNLTYVVLPETLTALGEGAFKNTHLGGVTVPAGVSVIPKNAFRECKKLECAVIKGATRVQSAAFKDCGELAHLFLGENLTLIEDDALSGAKLTKLVVPKNAIRVGSDNLNKNMHIAITGEETVIELRDEYKELEATVYTRQSSKAWQAAKDAQIARRPLCEFKI